MSEAIDPLDLPPLKITCTSTDCERDLHCFKQKRRKKGQLPSGPCRDCGADLIDFDRVHRRDGADRDYTFVALRRELIRHHFWHLTFDDKARQRALKLGRRGIMDAAITRIRKSVGPASHKLFRDGMQTPMKGNVLFYAQHATASCCRKCIEYWHNIPRDRDLSDSEVLYLVDLVRLYIAERLPDLPEDAELVRARNLKPSRRPAKL